MLNDEETIKAKVIAAARRAIASAGGSAACTDKLNRLLPFGKTVTQQAVDKWKRSGVPPKKVLFMERIQSRMDRYDLQPEVYGERPEQ